MSGFARRRTFPFSAVAAATLSLSSAASLAAQSIPPRLADTTFWRMVNEFSEPGGFFRSDNFVSNETSFQWVIPELQNTVKPGGVYVGVAPDQNFTYLVALKPKIAFIVDIRHQNAIQHLMYKALIELSDDRAEFVSRLFSKPRPAGLDSASSAAALFQSIVPGFPDSAHFRKNLAAIKERLVKVHGFVLSDSELTSLERVYGAFYTSGPDLTYNFGGGAGGGYGRNSYMPTYQALMMESDGAGKQHSYLATEANYRALKDLEERNLVVPLTGNFAGDKALRAVGQWVRDRGARVTAFYTSNVEQYLFQSPGDWSRFYKNVATLPIDSTSTFIRSYSMNRYTGTDQFRQQSPNSRSLQLISSIAELLKVFAEGNLQGYFQVIQLSHQ
ncbi:MAG TPA: hypothetical protein VHE78_19535 [Gemmatimonadaceae bacterium]|nr:hypothetical protein [Gemmatimonadaceae bacterium]